MVYVGNVVGQKNTGTRGYSKESGVTPLMRTSNSWGAIVNLLLRISYHPSVRVDSWV